MSIKFLVLGGGYFGFFLGGGKCRFYFYGREDFSEKFWCVLIDFFVAMFLGGSRRAFFGF